LSQGYVVVATHCVRLIVSSRLALLLGFRVIREDVGYDLQCAPSTLGSEGEADLREVEVLKFDVVLLVNGLWLIASSWTEHRLAAPKAEH
jgi:hypothetical protein